MDKQGSKGLNKNKPPGYSIQMTKFIEKWRDGYVYEITFNRSLEHTHRYQGIEKGLDMYEKYENSTGLKKWLIRKLMGFRYG